MRSSDLYLFLYCLWHSVHDARAASRFPARAAAAPSFVIETQFVYPGGAIPTIASSALASAGRSPAWLAADVLSFIHFCIGQSGRPFFPHVTPPSPPPSASGAGAGAEADAVADADADAVADTDADTGTDADTDADTEGAGLEPSDLEHARSAASAAMGIEARMGPESTRFIVAG